LKGAKRQNPWVDKKNDIKEQKGTKKAKKEQKGGCEYISLTACTGN
jgi:hypothetical protein